MGREVWVHIIHSKVVMKWKRTILDISVNLLGNPITHWYLSSLGPKDQRPPLHPSGDSIHKMFTKVLDAREKKKQQQLDQQAKEKAKAEAFKRSIFVESQQHFDITAPIPAARC